MKIINLEQNTPEWLSFRRSHIGASDAPVIMGANPYKSLKRLWRDKVLGEKEKDNPMMSWGRDQEANARIHFEISHQCAVLPQVVVHPEHSWMSASLDGLDIGQEFIVEIKCPGEKNHTLAKNGIIPAHYVPQLQHQLACTGLEDAFYYSFDGYSGVSIHLKRDDEYIKKMIDEEFKFWETISIFN